MKEKFLIFQFPIKAVSLNQAYPTGKSNRRFLSKKGKEFKEFIYYYTLNKVRWKLNKKDKFNVSVHFWFKDKKVRDVDNYFKLLIDSLTGILWEDDSQIHILSGQKHQGKKDNIDIEIKKY